MGEVDEAHNMLSHEELLARGFAEGEELLLSVPEDMFDDSDDEPVAAGTGKGAAAACVGEALKPEKIREIMYGAPRHAHSERSMHEKDAFFASLGEPVSGPFAIPRESALERVEYASIEREDFETRFCSAPCGRPCILLGVPEAEGWPARDTWADEDRFLQEYGESLQLPITELFPTHGMGKAQKLRVPLRAYQQYAVENEVDFPYYPWERDFEGGGTERLLKDFWVPQKLFSEDLFDLSVQTRASFPLSCHRFVIIGGARTGAVIHQDPKCSGAWNTLLFGRKRWVFAPPDVQVHQLRGASGNSDLENYRESPPAYWWFDSYPDLHARAQEIGLLEVVQTPGDTIFVPPNWWHAVVNLPSSGEVGGALTLACTQNCLTPAMLLRGGSHCWPALVERSPEAARALHEALQTRRPELASEVERVHGAVSIKCGEVTCTEEEDGLRL
eukprot:gnl/TRDRNA2_/TRDRNA2_82226_c0_seq1.p1 gnl/TRDRNA2_/TRDRNA2_82226_c0~~gnl/TRDRNA2_/TRDRNA2_82226_c0_seq1.p1  ORF type:complete len:445 (+),score=85.10 gnl/TRDRNA2_/TRDRNA2_82226_c0_seq1:86-1420(+)